MGDERPDRSSIQEAETAAVAPVPTSALLRASVAAIEEGSEPPAPERIGGYRILAYLGRGGMGVVYLAVREGDDDSRVAIKVLRPGMDTEDVLRRFELERQLLAALDHPGIAAHP